MITHHTPKGGERNMALTDEIARDILNERAQNEDYSPIDDARGIYDAALARLGAADLALRILITALQLEPS